jgi:hypothetical protein
LGYLYLDQSRQCPQLIPFAGFTFCTIFARIYAKIDRKIEFESVYRFMVIVRPGASWCA